MKLWYLTRNDVGNVYDEALGFVVRAETEQRARKIASETCGDEGPDYWLEATTASCLELKQSGSECLVLQSFRNA